MYINESLALKFYSNNFIQKFKNNLSLTIIGIPVALWVYYYALGMIHIHFIVQLTSVMLKLGTIRY